MANNNEHTANAAPGYCQMCADCGYSHNPADRLQFAANTVRDHRKPGAPVDGGHYYRWDGGHYPYYGGSDNRRLVHVPCPQPMCGYCRPTLVPCSYSCHAVYPGTSCYGDNAPPFSGSYFAPPNGHPLPPPSSDSRPSTSCSVSTPGERTGSDVDVGQTGDVIDEDGLKTEREKEDTRLPEKCVKDALDLSSDPSEVSRQQLDTFPVKESSLSLSPPPPSLSGFNVINTSTNMAKSGRPHTRGRSKVVPRRTVTPLYGLPSWWGEDQDATTHAATTATTASTSNSGSRRRSAANNVAERDSSSSLFAAQPSHRSSSDVTGRAPTSSRRRSCDSAAALAPPPPDHPVADATAGDVATPPAPRRPPVAFTVNLQAGQAIDIGDRIGRFLPPARLRHLGHRRSGANNDNAGRTTGGGSGGASKRRSRQSRDEAASVESGRPASGNLRISRSLDDLSDDGTYTVDVEDAATADSRRQIPVVFGVEADLAEDPRRETSPIGVEASPIVAQTTCESVVRQESLSIETRTVELRVADVEIESTDGNDVSRASSPDVTVEDPPDAEFDVVPEPAKAASLPDTVVAATDDDDALSNATQSKPKPHLDSTRPLSTRLLLRDQRSSKGAATAAASRVPLDALNRLVLTIYTDDSSLAAMSRTTAGQRPVDRRRRSDTARSTTSVSTDLLLQNAAAADEPETARSVGSVDTDVLLGDLGSPGRGVAQSQTAGSTTGSRSVTNGAPSGGEKSPVPSRRALPDPSKASSSVTAASGWNSFQSTETGMTWGGDLSRSLATDASWTPVTSVKTSSVWDRVEYLPTPGASCDPASAVTKSVSWDPTVAAVPSVERPARSGSPPSASSGRQRLDASIDVARSVASVDCASVVYDTDRRGGPPSASASADLRRTVDSFAYSDDFDASDDATRTGASGVFSSLDTQRSDASLDAAILLRDSAVRSPPSGGATVETINTSRTLASIDTNILLQTTEEVVVAMEAVRSQHVDHEYRLEVSDNVVRRPSPKTANGLGHEVAVHDEFEDGCTGSNEFTPRPVDTDCRSPDNVTDTDFDTDRRDVDELRQKALQSTTRRTRKSTLHKPPVNVRQTGKSTGSNWHTPVTGAGRGVWRSLSDHDMSQTGLKQSVLNSSSTAGHRTITKSSTMSPDDSSTTATDTERSSTQSFAIRHHVRVQRTRSASRTGAGSVLESERSVTSGVSLGQKIVARSRDNNAARSQPQTRNVSGAVAKKTADVRHQPSSKQFTPPSKKRQDSQSSSPSGLVLEGYRVPMRPSSTGVFRQQPTRPSTRETGRREESSETRRNERCDVRDRSATRDGWTSGMNDIPLYSDCHSDDASSDAQDTERHVDDSLVSAVCQLSSTIKMQSDQIAAKLQQRLHIPIDTCQVDEHASPVIDCASKSRRELLATLDNLQQMGRQLLAINKALTTTSSTTKNVRRQRHDNRYY